MILNQQNWWFIWGWFFSAHNFGIYLEHLFMVQNTLSTIHLWITHLQDYTSVGHVTLLGLWSRSPKKSKKVHVFPSNWFHPPWCAVAAGVLRMRAAGLLVWPRSVGPERRGKKYFLRVFPTLTHYWDIVPDTPSGLYIGYIYIYI